MFDCAFTFLIHTLNSAIRFTSRKWDAIIILFFKRVWTRLSASKCWHQESFICITFEQLRRTHVLPVCSWDPRVRGFILSILFSSLRGVSGTLLNSGMMWLCLGSNMTRLYSTWFTGPVARNFVIFINPIGAIRPLDLMDPILRVRLCEQINNGDHAWKPNNTLSTWPSSDTCRYAVQLLDKSLKQT